MNSDKLDKEEAELLATYDAGEWHSVAEVQSEAARYREAARATFRKDKRVNIRISSKVFDRPAETRHHGRHPLPDVNRQRAAQIRIGHFGG